MEATTLWKIVQKMPKGALLHCHLSAMVELDWVFSEAIETEGMYISSPVALVTEEVRKSADIKILFQKVGKEDGSLV